MNLGKKKINSLVKLWSPPILWAALIFILSSFPTGKATHLDIADFILKKTAHVVIYGSLTVLLYRAFKNSGLNKKDAALVSLATAVFYGITDEIHQSFTPGRDPTVRDVIFDTMGSVLAIYTLWKLLPKAPPRLRSLAKSLQLI